MSTETIVLEVDAELAQAYREAPESDQSKLSLLLNLWLRELFAQSTSLATLMDEQSDKTEGRGLTADKLADVLDGC
jgi:hypothetical protein